MALGIAARTEKTEEWNCSCSLSDSDIITIMSTSIRLPAAQLKFRHNAYPIISYATIVNRIITVPTAKVDLGRNPPRLSYATTEPKTIEVPSANPDFSQDSPIITIGHVRSWRPTNYLRAGGMNKQITAVPLAYSDIQLGTLFKITKPLSPSERGAFLSALTMRLRWEQAPTISDDRFARIAAEMLKEQFPAYDQTGGRLRTH